MRIFYAAQSEPWPGCRLWYNNLYLPLVDLGHEVVVFDYPIDPYYAHADPSVASNRAFIKRNRPRLEEALLNQIKRLHREKPIDVFFSYFYNAHCRPRIIREIRQMGIVTANWYCNASYQFDLVSDIALAYDYCLVPEKFRLDDYRRVGANPIYCQEAANPNIYKPYPLPREFEVTFVGQKYGDRPLYIRHLLDAGIQVRVWGQGWQTRAEAKPQSPSLGSRLHKLFTVEGWRRLVSRLRRLATLRSSAGLPVTLPPEICGPSLDDLAMIQMYSHSRISLGFSNVGETYRTATPIKQVRLRDFEAPMSGAFYMVEYMQELEEFFDIGKEIVCYHDPADLADKARYYLDHDSERERIRQAGYKRAVQDHTWQKRFQHVFREMGLA